MTYSNEIKYRELQDVRERNEFFEQAYSYMEELGFNDYLNILPKGENIAHLTAMCIADTLARSYQKRLSYRRAALLNFAGLLRVIKQMNQNPAVVKH